MGDHGASAIVPFNRFLMIGCVAFSLFMLPWWITLSVFGLIGTIWKVASDQYGGMQICVVLLPGLFLGLATLGRHLQESESADQTAGLGYTLLITILPMVLFAITMLGAMLMIVAVALLWEWLMKKVRTRQK